MVGDMSRADRHTADRRNADRPSADRPSADRPSTDRPGTDQPAEGNQHDGTVSEVARTLKPHLRGWLHAGTFPLALAAGIVLVTLAPAGRATVATAIYATSAVLLFGVSAVYHRGTWGPRWHGELKRLDHANIILIIAGTYTPFAVLQLHKEGGTTLLWVVWA
ncbi:MAG: hemolysin, partial [Actinomycetota bacterium]|nr:hemolysin [Actinomycetota bacterium]